ncbi:MAG: hypothetical protein HGA41_10635 [Syntrophaceae bacterium]|nr:hypothetical protein [Syntrophaceae bacterium]
MPIGQKGRRCGIADISAQQQASVCDDSRGRSVRIAAGAGGELQQKQRLRRCTGDLHDTIVRHVDGTRGRSKLYGDIMIDVWSREQ